MTLGSRSDGVLRKAGDGSAAAFAVIPAPRQSHAAHWPQQAAVNAGQGDRRSRGWRGCRVIHLMKRPSKRRRSVMAAQVELGQMAGQRWGMQPSRRNSPPPDCIPASLCRALARSITMHLRPRRSLPPLAADLRSSTTTDTVLPSPHGA